MNRPKILLFTALGVVFWFNAAMIIRFCGPAVFTAGNPWLLLFFGLAIPLTLLSLLITKAIARRRLADLLEPVVIMTLTAAMLDGLALAWFRSLYSASLEVALHGAAWILWGAGFGLLLAYLFHNSGMAPPAPRIRSTATAKPVGK